MQAAANIDYKSLYEQSQKQNSELQIALTGLQHQLAQLQKMIFGARHERFIPSGINPSQLTLDIQAESTAACSVVDAKKITYTKTTVTTEQKPLVHPGRMKLPEHLRREEIIIEPSEDITCLRKMGEEITEVLEWE